MCLENKLVCDFKLAANVVGVESGSLCMMLTDQQSRNGICGIGSGWQLVGLS